jgi:hypothetical protein
MRIESACGMPHHGTRLLLSTRLNSCRAYGLNMDACDDRTTVDSICLAREFVSSLIVDGSG